MSKFNLSFDKNILRKLRRIYKKDKLLYKKYKNFLVKFSEDPFYPSLNTHKVFISDYGSVYSSSVTGDIRVIWSLEEDYVLRLLDIGGHEGSRKVYR